MNDRGQVEAQGTGKGADPPDAGAWRCLTLSHAEGSGAGKKGLRWHSP